MKGSGKTAQIAAVVTNAVDGGAVHWFIDEQDKGAGETFTVNEAKKDFRIQARYIKDGKTVAESGIETVKVKSGFFARFKAFFRALFGKLPKVVQAAYDFDLLLNLLP